jgi:hypothetical protein
MKANTARQAWLRNEGKRAGLLTKVELCCKLTLPRLWYDEGEEDNYAVGTLDFQSLGALCVSHMSNRTVLTMFPPSRGFFRMDAPKDITTLATELGIPPTDVAAAMSEVEKGAFGFLESSLQRPKLTRMAELLLATGNCLVEEEGDSTLRVMSLKYFTVQRTRKGALKELVIREKMLFDELDDDAQQAMQGIRQPDQEVEFFRWICRQPGGSFKETVWVDNIQLPFNVFGSRYASEDKLPYHVLTWALSDNKHYGTGLVEDYLRDFSALSAVAQAGTEGAVACAQNRVLVDPGSTTKPDDFNNSVNNQAIPGTENSVSNIMLGNPAGVTVASTFEEKFDRRLRQAFMLTSGIIRQAERLTAYEIRKMAEEMDIQHGGSYSALSGSVQPWMARWCLRGAKTPKEYLGGSIKLVTGTDALSRNADVDNIRLAFEDLGAAKNLPEPVQAEIDWKKLIAFVGAGRQTPLGDFLLTDEQKKQRTSTTIANQADQAYATTAAETAATPQ